MAFAALRSVGVGVEGKKRAKQRHLFYVWMRTAKKQMGKAVTPVLKNKSEHEFMKCVRSQWILKLQK
jgi:hypothetical protein